MQTIARQRVASMGTDAHLIVAGSSAERLLGAAGNQLEELERRWSRFLPGSEVSRLNAARGAPCVVSAETVTLVDRAVTAWRLTGGRFDPTMLRAMRGLGYDRPFSEGLRSDSVLPAQREADGCAGIIVDTDARIVQLPDRLEFDPGGIGKGLAADLVVTSLMEAGAEGAMVNIGGDLRAEGRAPGDEGWGVAIREPTWSHDPIATLRLSCGAVATSTTLRRRWAAPEGERHHLIDPGTGAPRQGGAVLVVSVASEGWWAEATATARVATGQPVDCPNLCVDSRGRLVRSNGFERYES